MTVVRLARVPAALLAAAALAGCSGGSGRAAAPSSEATTPTPAATSGTPIATLSAIPPAQQLAAVAAAAEHARYTATYAVHPSSTASPAKNTVPTTVTVALAGSAAKVTLTGHGRTATFLQTPNGAYACETSNGPPRCFLLSSGTRHIPADLDPQLEHVFLDYPAQLADHVGDYRVQRVSAPADLPTSVSSTCFAIRPVAKGAAVAAGTYCFSAVGVVTEVVYPSGRLVLQKLGPAPSPGSLRPLASPQPLATG